LANIITSSAKRKHLLPRIGVFKLKILFLSVHYYSDCQLYLPTNPFALKKIICTVTNDLSYDQRMQRICTSLANGGYEVWLIGRKLKDSKPLAQQAFHQKRLTCWFNHGFLFYAEYNLRLFIYLFFAKSDALYAVDLDTIMPVFWASELRGKKRLYDAHELFTEQKEIVTRPVVYKFWMAIERFAVPKFRHGYTVNRFIQQELHKRYGVHFGIIRNLPVKDESIVATTTVQHQPFIIYQGAVNEGRSFETLIPAMQQVNAPLMICGKGNFFEQTKALVKQYHLEEKVILKGYVTPAELKLITPTAAIGLTLFESTGLNQYYSLSNRFFDYINAEIPLVCVGYPEYKAIVDQYEVALLIENTDQTTIAAALNNLLTDTVLYNRLKQACKQAKQELNWENESQQLLLACKKVFNPY
jgi:glycosyltransferase involved in cell wall biosynthesis